MTLKPHQGLGVAHRLAQLGVEVRPVELQDEAKRLNELMERGGNRQMRRNAVRAAKKASR